MEEFGSASVTAMVILEGNVKEGIGKVPVVKKTTPNGPAGFELENAGGIVVIKEKILEDKNPIKLKEEATPKPVNPFSKELGIDEMTQESKLLSVSQFEDTFSRGAGDKMNMDEENPADAEDEVTVISEVVMQEIFNLFDGEVDIRILGREDGSFMSIRGKLTSR
ncbi:hypothetical protein MA16_Dca000417 [Dendrobium catenatum]|uniref:Uncharacterized protein n=1 Tax=Dendrobium catenatum TaxID=906689 RepID=A0A2I0WTW0_9ASPA|nr:hypothetical protein MA16_Dca000417 [Dendrobium catenatum]